MIPILSAGLILTILVAPGGVQAPATERLETIDTLAARVAGEGTVFERTTRLVSWINTEFDWTATDYQQRTAEQIIERRGGNCADLAKVLARLLDGVHIRYRFVREINIQPASESRQANAERRITTNGARFSVFGRRHNDHTWLEVLDTDSGTWIPADPAMGVVGVRDWIASRIALADRRKPVVAATVPIAASMIAPFVVASGNEDLSTHYLIDEFDRAYGGRLRSLAAWPRWSALVRQLAPLAMRAFAGTVNLHEHAATITEAAETYEALQRQASAAGLTLK